MADRPLIAHLAPLAQNYDALLCDAWGVIHNGVHLFDDVAEALTAFRGTCGPVVILTNAPRPSAIIPAQLDRLGLDRAAYDGVVTSGDTIRTEIKKRLPKRFFRLGPDKDDPLFDSLDITFSPFEDAEAIICTGMIDDTTETPEDYRAMLTQAVGRDMEMICANPDIKVRWGDRVIWCAGALAQLFEQLGGRVAHGGKPHRPIYDLAFETLAALKPGIERQRILCIGDGLQTDILGANRNGFDVVYVFGAGGIHEGASDAASLAKLLDEQNVTARATMERLVW
ncbi:MAG: TIGR01459 family HAD-type hydrolase [Pseudomonadota bacterium]